MTTTEPKSMMSDADMVTLRAHGRHAQSGCLTIAEVGRLGAAATRAADTIAALTAQNRELAERCQGADAEVASLREQLRSANEDKAAHCRELAAALRVETANWPALLAKVAPAGENRQSQHARMCSALRVDKTTSWNALEQLASECRSVAEKWNAATAAPLGTMDLVRVYYQHAGLAAPATDNPENYEPRTAAILAVAAHVRAHEAAVRAAEHVAPVSPSEGQVGDEVEHKLSPGRRGVVTATGAHSQFVEWSIPYVNYLDGYYDNDVLRVVKRAGDVPPTTASKFRDPIDEWLTHLDVGGDECDGIEVDIVGDDAPRATDVRRLARAFTALVAEVRALRADRECGEDQ